MARLDSDLRRATLVIELKEPALRATISVTLEFLLPSGSTKAA